MRLFPFLLCIYPIEYGFIEQIGPTGQIAHESSCYPVGNGMDGWEINVLSSNKHTSIR